MNNFKFTFVAGAPGSGWSMISQRLKRSLRDFDRSDETEERQYHLPKEHTIKNYNVTDSNWSARTHIGCYYGPYHEFGNQFDNLSVYDNNVDEFYRECLKPYRHDHKNRKLIKCHWFAYNLDWLWKNCKGHDLMLVWRDSDCAEEWWYTMGGWDIKHPVYDWYQNKERMHEQIIQETNNIWNFGNQKYVQWNEFDAEDTWITKTFNSPKPRAPKAIPKRLDPIKIGYITIT